MKGEHEPSAQALAFEIPEELRGMASEIGYLARRMAAGRADDPTQLALSTRLVCAELIDMLSSHKYLAALSEQSTDMLSDVVTTTAQ